MKQATSTTPLESLATFFKNEGYTEIAQSGRAQQMRVAPLFFILLSVMNILKNTLMFMSLVRFQLSVLRECFEEITL